MHAPTPFARSPKRVRAVALVVALVCLPASASNAQGAHRASGSLSSFRSDDDLLRYLKQLVEARKARAQKPQPPVPCTGAASTWDVTSASQRGATVTSASPATIQGRVTGVDGKALGDAQVIVSSLLLVAYTDSGGRYRIVVPAGKLEKSLTVTVTTRRVGFGPRSQALEIQRGDSARTDFTLCGGTMQLEQVVVSAADYASVPTAKAVDESVTNTQHAGVDEGGIVKLHGDHLVMLRRGRLFTVSIAGGALRPIASVDAFGPDIDPNGTWYDELLVYGDKVIVVGFSYERGGTEIGTFRIDGAGGLRYLATYQLHSNDYYSSRNYASRVVNGKLVFYTPTYLPRWDDDVRSLLPALRRWRGDTSEAARADFKGIAAPRRVYKPARPLDDDVDVALHTVTTCDLTAPELECVASVVVGPAARVFYVSPTSVYVWVSPWGNGPYARPSSSMIYRMPLDGGAPSAIAVSGTPVDQFSFLEDDAGVLHVLVRSEGEGDAMWMAHWARGSTALLDVPLESFGDGRRSAPSRSYLPVPTAQGQDLQNRFVGRHLLYGTGNGWGAPQTSARELYVVGLDDRRVSWIELPHAVDRIEPMGADAVVIGSSRTDLQFSGIRLSGLAKVVQRFTLPGASQGELRSHGFFYKPDGPESGVIGLPVRGEGRPGYRHLVDGSASVLFLHNASDRFDALGELAAFPTRDSRDDACRASCVDWYGNARPLFARGRVFALLGYELVEGAISDGRIREVARASYAPPVLRGAVRR